LSNRYPVLMGTAALLIGIFLIAAGAGFADWQRSVFDEPAPNLINTVQYLGAIDDDGTGSLLSHPLAMAVDRDNEFIYVTDTGRNRVNVYTIEGNFLRYIEGSFNYPNALAVDNEGRLYVGEFRSNNIKVFDGKGILVDVWSGKKIGSPLSPLALDYAGERIYVANRTGEILVLDTKGKLQYKFGAPGNLKGLLSYPNGIAVWGDSIYVSDSGNGRLQVFDVNGEVLRVVSRQDLPVSVPRGIAVDKRGKIYLADTLGHRVLVLNEYYQIEMELGKNGLSGDKMNFPNDVEIIDNRMYVTDREHGRVLVYALPDNEG